MTIRLSAFKAVSLVGILLAGQLAMAADTADYRAKQWPLDEINADQAHQIATGQGVVVAVVDSGIDLNHPEFVGKIVGAVSFVCPDGEPVPCFGEHVRDGVGHGTHVAGTIVAPADGKGITGVAPDAKVMPIRIFDDGGSSDMAKFAAGVNWAVDHGADVISLSIGLVGGTGVAVMNPVLPLDEGFAAAIERAADAGIFVAIAAGNDSVPYCGGSEFYADNGLCVGAHGPGSTVAYYSDWGLNVDVLAPGGAGISGCDNNVLATWPEYIESSCGYNGYQAMYGTSMATPHVAGIGALLAELGVRGRDARERILATSQSFPVVLFGGLAGPFVNAYDAVNGLP